MLVIMHEKGTYHNLSVTPSHQRKVHTEELEHTKAAEELMIKLKAPIYQMPELVFRSFASVKNSVEKNSSLKLNVFNPVSFGVYLKDHGDSLFNASVTQAYGTLSSLFRLLAKLTGLFGLGSRDNFFKVFRYLLRGMQNSSDTSVLRRLPIVLSQNEHISTFASWKHYFPPKVPELDIIPNKRSAFLGTPSLYY